VVTRIGTEANDTLTGKGTNDSLIGNGGNDTLNGGAGDDDMSGGDGDDVYIVDSVGDQIFEDDSIQGSSGNDSIRTSLSSYSLGGVGLEFIENLSFTGIGAASLTGNLLNNLLAGGKGADTLNGGTGLDTLRGGAGNDTLIHDGDITPPAQQGDPTKIFDGGTGTDTLRVTNTVGSTFFPVSLNNAFLSSIEKISFGSVASTTMQVQVDFFQLGGGLSKNAELIGGAGTDKFLVLALTSGSYTLSSFTLTNWTTDFANPGTSDAVILSGATSGQNYTLRAAASHDGLQVLGGNDGDDMLIGGNSNEVLAGNAGADTLTPGDGNDTMEGGTGADVYVVDGDGVKVITGFTVGTDLIDLRETGVDSFDNLAPFMFVSGGNTVLQKFTNGVATTYTFQGVTNLGASDFIFSTSTAPRSETGTGGIDVLAGSGGNDKVQGLGGNDTMFGLNGNDTLDGGLGNDSMFGGAGDDSYIIDVTGDLAFEDVGAGTDTIRTSLATYSLASLGNIENLTYTGSSAAALTGNSGNNSLMGGSGADTLNGGGGADTLNGGNGNDTLVRSGDTTSGMLFNGGSGTDTLSISNTVLSGTIYNTILANASVSSIERIIFDSVTTNTVFQIAVLAGQIGPGIAFGTELVGGAGLDNFVVIASSPDTYRLPSFTLTNWTTGSTAATSDVVRLDAASSSGSYTLFAAGRHDGIQVLNGSNGNDKLFGGLSNELLNGGNGADTLDPEDGNDTMTGGGGSDIFVVDGNGTKLITDFTDGTDCIDLSETGFDNFASIVPYLSEVNGNAVLSASPDGVLTSYTLQGVSLASLSAADFIFSTENVAGSVSGTSASELINARAGSDIIFGLGGNDTINGFGGADTIDGGAGNDRLVGGAGNDIYILNSGNDTVVENASEGVDTIQTSQKSYGLSNIANVENLTYTGTSNATLAGNSGDNGLTGSTGNDKISGAGGADTIRGGSGNDTLTGGAGADAFFFDVAPNASNNIDQIKDFTSATDVLQLFHATFSALGASVGSDQFISGPGVTTAQTSLQLLIYNTSNGALYYDADGDGVSFNPVQFATLNGAPTLTFEDFSVFGLS
jgi:serralysin